MNKRLTALDIRILQALCEVGPRNLSEVARTLKIPRATLRFRINRMYNHPKVSLRCAGCIYHTYLGMKKAVVTAKAFPGREQLLLECLKANDFWARAARSYGEGEGCAMLYTIPVEHTSEFEAFLDALQKEDIAEEVALHWSTCFEPGKITLEWFDEETSSWSFRWDRWVKEIEKADTRLPLTLQDPKDFPNYGDEIDVFILKELEKDAMQHLQNIARKLRISLQRARYHYEKHLVEKNLLEGFHVSLYPHDPELSDESVFLIEFYDNEYFAKFANSLRNKHFVKAMGKVLGENMLILLLRGIPRLELRNFVDALAELAKRNLVKNYRYYLFDPRYISRKPLPYELFKKNKWIYEHEKYMARVKSLIQKSNV